MDFFDKVKDWLLERLQKIEFSQEPIHLLLAILTGIFAGFGGILFYRMIQLVEHLMFDSPAGFFGLTNLINLEGWRRYLIIPIIPAIGGLIVGWIAVKFAPDSSGEGVPMVIENVAK
ncbi:MAG: hypothetical protein B7Z63_06395, partial [Ignavibacteriae bacterium 37-53-5]